MEKEPLKRDIHRHYYEDHLRDPQWKHFSDALKKERGYTCEVCGENEEDDDVSLEVHHLGYRVGALPWEYRDVELLVACRDCHANLHYYADQVWNEVLKTGNQYVIHECLKAVKEVLRRHPYHHQHCDVPHDI